MAETYLSVARQGRNHWWRYLATLVLALALTIGSVLIVSLPIIVVGVLQGQEPPNSDLWIHQPQWFFSGAVVVSGLMSLGLILGITLWHHRAWLTVLNPQGRIRWRRLLQGAGVWLGLMMLNVGVLALFDRDRYQFQFSLAWMWWWLPVLLTVPFMALMMSLFYGYLLQGIGLIGRRPVRVTMLATGLWGGLTLLAQGNAGILNLLPALIYPAFLIWIVLQDDGLELFMGIQAASLAIALLLINEPEATPWIPRLLTITTPDVNLLGSFLSWLLRLGLFYWIVFHWLPGPVTDDRPATPTDA